MFFARLAAKASDSRDGLARSLRSGRTVCPRQRHFDLEAALHKGITGGIADRADVLLMSSLDMGNVFYKTMHFFAHAKMASAL